MDEKRKQLYRKLLYWAMIDIRSHSSWPNSVGYFWQWRNRSRRQVLRFTYALSNLLHNLAQDSARDFEGFDEELFWHYHRIFRQELPASKWAPHLESVVAKLQAA